MAQTRRRVPVTLHFDARIVEIFQATSMNEGGRADHPRVSKRIDELAAEVRQLRDAVRARELLLEERERQLADKSELVSGMLTSRSWRLTRPLRTASQLGRRASAVVRGRAAPRAA